MCYPYSLEKRVNGWYKLLIGVVIVFGLIALVTTTIFNYRINSISEELNALKTPKNEVISHSIDAVTTTEWIEKQSMLPVSDKIAFDFMVEAGIEHPHIVLAQMKLESGNYTSKLALENNNYFGMKQPRKRATTSIGEKNGYASYKSWVHSVLDYALWQKEYASKLTENQYLDSLSSYAEDKNYIGKVKKLSKNLENKQ